MADRRAGFRDLGWLAIESEADEQRFFPNICPAVVMRPNIPQAVRELVDEYRRFLRTSYRFLDDHLRRQFEAHLDRSEVIVRGPYVTLGRDFARGRSLSASLFAEAS